MKVAVVGATGLVGSKMLQVLEERNFPLTELLPVASEKSVGKEITYKGRTYKVMGMADAVAAVPTSPSSRPEEAPRSSGPPNLPR